jgi:predicted transglutaminase-like cysteine proteinase
MGRNLLLALALLIAGIVPSLAEGLVPLARNMPVGYSTVTSPAGFINFCTRFVDQCASDGPKLMALTPEAWAKLQEVNDRVNRAIMPEADMSHYGIAEYWTIPSDGRGDCEEYALSKRKELVAAGFPIRALRMAIAILSNGERHAVLTIATDHGDYVLDNLVANVKSWDNTGYQWVARQDPETAWGWVSLLPAEADSVEAEAAGNVGAANSGM